MKKAMEETQRRRKAQELFNLAHNITPKGILKKIENPLEGIVDGSKQSRIPIEDKYQASSNKNIQTPAEELLEQLDIAPSEIPKFIKIAKQKMHRHAKVLEFEEAAKIRDQIKQLEAWLLRFS